MTWLLFHDQAPAFTPSPAALGEARPRTDFFQNMRAGFQAQTLTDNSLSRESNLFDAYQPIVAALTDAAGRPVMRNPYRAVGSGTGNLEAEIQRVWQEVSRRRQADPQALAGLPGSREALEAQVKEQVLARRKELADITSRATASGAVGEFIGATGSAMLDPPNILTLTAGAGISAGVLRTVLVESLIGAGTEALIQPKVAAYYQELGIDYTAGDFLANVALGGAAGGVFAGGAKAAQAVVQRALKKQAAGEELTPEERAEAAAAVAQVPEHELAAIAEDAGIRGAEAADAAQNLRQVGEYEHPLPPDAAQAERLAHARLVEDAETALETGGELPSSEIPARYSPDPPPSTLEGQPGPNDVDVSDIVAFLREVRLDNLNYTNGIQEVADRVGVAAGPGISRQIVIDQIKARYPGAFLQPEYDFRGYQDTRGRGVQYHGTSQPIDQLEEYTYSTMNFYGQGFYTSDAVDVVHGYASRRNADQPTMYQVSERAPVSLYDMEAPIDPALMTVLRRDGGDLIDEALEESPANLRELFDIMRDVSRTMQRSADDVQDDFGFVAHELERLGFGGMRHLGGLQTRVPAHQVKIYFRPKEQLDLVAVDPTAFRAAPSDPVTSPVEIRAAQEGVPARAAATRDPARDLTGFAEPAGAGTEAQSDGLRIDLGEVDDSLEIDLFAGTDSQGNEVTERLTKAAALERQDAELDFLDQLQVVCRTTGAAA